MIKDFTVTPVKAIVESVGDKEMQIAMLIHHKSDIFRNGDCLVFGYTSDHFNTDNDVLTALEDYSETDFYIDEAGIYHA